MKNTIKNLTTTVLIIIMTLSFTNITAQKKEIKTDKSTLVWKGYKVTGSHKGTINIKK